MIVSKGEKMLYKVTLDVKEIGQDTILRYEEHWDITTVSERVLFEPILYKVIDNYTEDSQFYAVLLEGNRKDGSEEPILFKSGRSLILEFMGDRAKKIHFDLNAGMV